MTRIDVICEAENLPRIRLLESHLQELQVVLQVHREMPVNPSPRILIVPKKTASRLANIPASPEYERIAVYLDTDAEPIAADYEVHLANWPARSSDPDVYRMAARLRRPIMPKVDSQNAQVNSQRTNRQDNRARWGLAAVVLVLGGLFVFESQKDGNQAELTDNTTPAHIREAAELERRLTMPPGQVAQNQAHEYSRRLEEEAHNRRLERASNSDQLFSGEYASGKDTSDRSTRAPKSGTRPDRQQHAQHAWTSTRCVEPLIDINQESIRWYSGVHPAPCDDIASATN